MRALLNLTMKLGFTVGLATVSRYLPKKAPDPGKQQCWITFLRNHKDGITAMNFFVAPTVGLRLLHAWFIIGRGRAERTWMQFI